MADDPKKPYGDVSYADPGYEDDKKKRYPLDSEEHCRAAWSYINQDKNAAKYSPEQLAKIKARIKSAGKKYGIEFADDAERSHPADDTYERSWALDDIIIRSGGDGRTVEAYATVFDTPTEINDKHGHYTEEIDRTAFNRTLANNAGRVGVYYHHGMTLHGTPSGIGAVPIGSPAEAPRADGKGLLTVTRYNKSELADAVLEAIRAGDLRGYSFSGRIFRSNPSRVPRVRPGAALPRIRRLELGLNEYGPTPTPAYTDAGILAVRSAKVLVALDEAQRFIQSLPTSFGDPGGDSATSNQELGTEDPRAAHSARLGLLRLRSKMRDRGM